MNKIYKVMYSKVKQCAVVVSEIAKSHGHNGESSGVRKHAALTAAVLIALGSLSFTVVPIAPVAADFYRNDYVGTNYTKDNGKSYAASETENYHGNGAKGVGSNTLGLNAIAGKNTVTIGDRDASLAQESVYIGSKYDANNQVHPSSGNNVVSVGYGSDAAGTGSIAIGSGAAADTFDNAGSGTNPDKASQSIAIGNNAQAKQNNIAIGAGSVATATASTADAYLTGQAAVSSYVSVGGGTVTTTDPKTKKTTTTTTLRRLTNVADGAADSDVATVGQLKKLSDKAGVYNEGWGIKIGDYTKKDANGQETTVKNAISIDRNLGSNEITSKSNNTFEAAGENSLILGGAGTDDFVAINGKHREKDYGSYGKDSVLVGGENNKTTKDGTYAVISGGGQNIASGEHSFIGGGWWNTATGATSTVVGGQANTASGNQSTVVGGQDSRAIGDESTILGGFQHTAVGENSTISGGAGAYTLGQYSSVSGGQGNIAIGMTSSADGGWLNFAYGDWSQASGGYSNYVLGNASNSLGGRDSVIQGNLSVGIAGGSTGQGAGYALAAGYQSVVTAEGVHREKSSDSIVDSYLEAGNDTGGNEGYKYTDVATALGYQATADAPNTVSFGHDKGDVSGYTVNWDYEFETDAQGNIKLDENDMPLVKAVKPNSISINYYDTAKYNRLVKAADGIEDHDAVVMEQLKNASDVGSKIKVYQTDENGNIKFDKNNNPIEDTSDSDAVKTKREAAQKASEDAWGKAIGTGKIADPTKSDTNDPEANGSQQLVTGGTVYTEVRPATDGTYVKTKNTTAANLTALDKQVAANTTKLGDKNHNIKYYSVKDKTPDDELLPSIPGYLNDKNDGAKGAGSMAAGFNTHADGVASTVAGSYSGVVGTGWQGAAALSYGTFNVNQNAAQAGPFSGVANSIVGQANVTTDSNAVIIYGAGNTVKNSYRDIDTKNAFEIMAAAGSGDVTKLGEALQKAVPTSGGQVMVMGGGNNVESAYMSQVVGVGNTVKGNQVYTKDAKTGKWNWTTDTNEKTAIKDYDPKKSSQYNYVDGFNNEVINGKHDYVIGANNKLSGDSYDDKEAKKYSNESNIVFGDNHTLTNTKNAVIIGSSDTQMLLDKGDNATAIGHNASAQRDALAVGVNTEARGNAVALGTSTIAHNNSIAIGTKATVVSSQNLAIGWEAHVGNIKTDDEKIKNAVALGSDSQVKVNDLLESDNNRGVLSIGDKDKERRIIHVRAGVNDTDAVNVSQLESVQSDLTVKGLKFAANSGDKYTAELGSTVTIQGTKKTEGHEYTADNLTTEIDEKGNITILMDKNMSVEKLAVNGKNGKDGAPGTPGSIGINGQDGESGIGIDGKDGISIKGNDGKDGVTIKVDNGKDGKDGSEGHIGLTGRDGSSANIIVKKGYDDKDKGINGANGVDGQDGITRIVYTDTAGDHQVATMEDGLKFKGDDTTVINKKLNNTLDIIGGAKGDLTEGNIGVKVDSGKLKVQLAKDLTDITSISNQKTEGGKPTGAKITLGDDGSVDVNGGKITHVGSGIEKDANEKYTVTDQNKGNAANIGDVQNMVNEAVNSAADTTNKALAGKANIDASNIGANLKHADGSVASADDQKANAEKWGSAIGTGGIKADDGRMVTGKTVYDEVRPTEDGNYVKKDETTGKNLSALDSKIGKLDETKKYNYIDSGKDVSISDNLTNLDTQVKNNADDIQNITNNMQTLSENAVKYDGSDKSKVTLDGKDGTTITNVKAGVLSENSSDAVNGGQLWQVDQKVDTNTKNITKNAGDITNLKNLSNITDAGKTVIKNLSKDAVQVKAGDRIKVDETTDDKGNKTYTISANNNGTVAKDDGNLISGGTLYNEVHVDKDGTYIKSKDSATGKDMTVAQNLSALDSGLKTTSDLIHTNTAGDTIQIGGSSTATKIDVSGKDKDGKSTGRIITGVVTDAADPTSAANVGYVNGVTAANTQQIYRDMNNAYGRLNNNINKAAAGSNALAALHPLDYDPDDKADFAVGYGHYRNANAAAVGAFYHPNENTVVNVGVSLGNGDPGFNAGVSFKVGRGGAGREAMSKTEMAKVINSQSKEIDALKKDNADKDKRIDALEQKMAEILAKLDKNGK